MAQPTQERLAAQLEKPEIVSGNVGHAGSGTGPENSPHFEEHEDDHVHHVSMGTYYIVFSFLILMLFVTVGAWYIDQHVRSLGSLSTPIAMAIAVAKAVAIVLIFMHVKFSSKLVQIFACTGVAFVAVMFVLTLQDYTTREWLPRPGVYATVPAPHIRASSVGAAPNAQSLPADNMAAMGKAPTTYDATNVGNSNSTVRGADISIAGGTASKAGTGGLTSGVVSQGDLRIEKGYGYEKNALTSGVVGQRDDFRPGATIGGAANNSFGSEVQSRGIERKPASRIEIAPGSRAQPTALPVAPR